MGVWAPDMSSEIVSLEVELIGALTQVRDFLLGLKGLGTLGGEFLLDSKSIPRVPSCGLESDSPGFPCFT